MTPRRERRSEELYTLPSLKNRSPRRPLIHSALHLSDDELTSAQRVGTRLASELAGMVHALSFGDRSIREISARLKIDRSLYQRILATSREQSDGVAALLRTPGYRGLMQFISAYEEAGGETSRATASRSAASALDQLTRKLAGSQTQFNSRLQATVASADPAASEQNARHVRRRRFEADVEIMGVEVGTRLSIELLRPLPGDPTQFEYATVQGSIGVIARHDGTSHLSAHRVTISKNVQSRVTTLDGQSIEENPTGMILERFTTDPQPRVSTRGPVGRSLLVLDAELRLGAPPMDVVTSRLISPAGQHPSFGADQSIDLGLTLRSPARHMLLDVYMHRSMAQLSVPSTGLFRPSDSNESFRQRWYDRFSTPPTLEVRSPQQMSEHLPSCPRIAELSALVFELLGWNSSEYVGNRIKVDYPLTSAQYVVGFDFAQNDNP